MSEVTRKLDLEKLEERIVGVVSMEDALRDVEPIVWSCDEDEVSRGSE